MPVLALDTSADISVCLVAAGPDADRSGVHDTGVGGTWRTLAERRAAEPRRHAELLAPMISEVLTVSGVPRRELTAVVVGTGPAPFTGLRAGLVTARMLGAALRIPVHGLCSLEALAVQALQDEAGDPEVLVATDARRREVYYARYRPQPRTLPDGATPVLTGVPDVVAVLGPGVDHPATLVSSGVTRDAVVAGPGADLYPELLDGARGTSPMRQVDPAVLAALAIGRAARGEATSTEPLYLRRPDVTPSAARKRATG